MKRCILFLAVILKTCLIFSQAIGSWKAYPALQISTYNIPAGDKIFSLCNGNLFSYNTKDTEIYVYDRINSLHDSQIAFIRYCEKLKTLVAIYSNGNIDLIYEDNSVTNLKQLKESNYSNLVINNLSICDTEAYISTNFGIVVVDINKEEFKNTYNLNLNVLCCIRNGNHIYMSSRDGCYIGDLSLNLLDKNNWTHVSKFAFHDIVLYNNEMFCLLKNTGFYHLDKNLSSSTLLEQPSFVSVTNNKMIVGNSEKIYVFDSADEYQTYTTNNNFNVLTYQNGTYWASCGIKGLQAYKLENNTLKSNGAPIQPNSPVRDYFGEMKFVGNRLLVAGGLHNYQNIIYEGTAMYYEDGKWYNFNEDGIEEKTGLKFQNLTSIAQDPNDENHHYVASMGQGLYEFKNLDFINRYDYSNSTLKTILPDNPNKMNYVRCSALTYDNDHNLWMSNNEVDSIINVLKSDGKWIHFYYPELANTTICDVIIFDQKKRLWMTSRRSSQAGIFFLDNNQTLENTKDDKHCLKTSITNQDGTVYTPLEFYTIVEDHDGHLWIGTSDGPFVITEPDKFINNDFTYEQIKIARNDGTDYADYLLSNIATTAIAVDAANRKWFGTSNNGVYLVSADGQEMLQHFTTDNSPLLSDNILSLAISPQTGEVMIGTDKGLVSYMSDANTPESELDKNNIYAFPNPVTPDYQGLISITGLTENAEVKITSVNGQLIYSGHSNGGLFTWNGKTKTGKRVASGIYNVISSTQDGKESVVTRITIIK